MKARRSTVLLTILAAAAIAWATPPPAEPERLLLTRDDLERYIASNRTAQEVFFRIGDDETAAHFAHRAAVVVQLLELHESRTP